MPFEKQGPVETFKERRVRLGERNSSVQQPIARIDKDIVKRKSGQGRKKKYTPTRMVNQINKYFEWCEEEDQVPSIKGMMIHLKLYNDMFYTYLTYPDFKDIMEQARLTIAEWAERDVYNTKGMAGGKLKYMQNVHGWTEKTETTSNITQTVVTVEQAKAKISALAPLLLEALKSSTLTNQLVFPDAEVVEVQK